MTRLPEECARPPHSGSTDSVPEAHAADARR